MYSHLGHVGRVHHRCNARMPHRRGASQVLYIHILIYIYMYMYVYIYIYIYI